jgi:UDP-N-acetylmuramyl pentapeptide phosphotransferase/UDP-N-acetylglucosamine-1-phosphate transferase
MILIALVMSALVTYLLVRYVHVHQWLTFDSAIGPQKFHTGGTSRVGGLGVFAGLWGAALIALAYGAGQLAIQTAMLLLCSIPAWGAGFAEDLTKKVGVGVRLGATMFAAAVAYFVLDGVLNRLDVKLFDFALAYGLVALPFTMVAVGGIANAINIVDGYNGLASVIAMFIFAALGYVATSVGDTFLATVSFAMLAALAGFIPWNFPKGRIFLGDGGAYFTGFMIGEISVLLVHRHPEVSAWFPLMLVAYPVWETLFSIYRKKVFKGQSPGDADGMHFHQLVYKRVLRWKVGSRDPTDRLVRNSLTSPYLWLFSLTTIIPAVIFWRDTLVLACWAFAFAALYVWLYGRIVRFRIPSWLILRRARQPPPAFDAGWKPSESGDRT